MSLVGGGPTAATLRNPKLPANPAAGPLSGCAHRSRRPEAGNELRYTAALGPSPTKLTSC